MDKPISYFKENSEIRCNIENGIRTCVNITSGNPFEEVKRYYTIKNENTKDMELKIFTSCPVQGLSCFSTNIKNSSKFAFIFFLALLFVSFIHELVHTISCYFSGVYIEGFLINIQGGITLINIENINTINHINLYFITIGPLLLVNLMFIAINFILYPPNKRIDTYINQKNILSGRIFENFIKACGYLSAITILTNTIFFPIVSAIGDLIGIAFNSDLMIAWDFSQEIEHPLNFRLLIIISVVIETAMAIMYILLYGKKQV